jgi:hypothetical protein
MDLHDGSIVEIDHNDAGLGHIQTHAEVAYFDADEVKVRFRYKEMWLGIFIPHSAIVKICS